MEAGKPVGELVSLKDYIQDPNTTHSLLDMYGRSVFLFWMVKGILGCLLLEKDEKGKGDEVPMHFWKAPHDDTCLMHKKMDIIMNRLGIPFLPSPSGEGAS